ncbi:MAG: glycosyl hydrolase 115 family protein [Clostridia bacterium]|nr:glycosyl hydrolase 115 family protein [Clostridia bacterium]
MRLFDKSTSLPIAVQKGETEAVLLAANDLRRDLNRISGKTDAFPFVEKASGCAIRIRTGRAADEESYAVTVSEDGILVEGSDPLGTVYGIYAVSTRLLGVLPTHRFTDLFPATQEEMELAETQFASEKRPVRFRGWFINDEDLLNGLKDSGYRRGLDYNYYRQVMDTEVMDAVLETALRLEYNLIIPATLLDIDRLGEWRLAEAAYRRGMYLSQHHIEPMGVSHFAAERYLKERGREGESLSFISNRAVMEELWRHYATRWSRFGDRVVWQLGLRGKKDEAVWKNDPAAPMTMEGRGAIISDAIATQHRILREILGTDKFHSTATLWNEGSLLYGKGFLTLPEGTVPILADFGIDQMFGEDMFTTQKEAGRRYGVYYHTSFWALGPHLCEGCSPEKMAYSYRIAAENDCLYYSMLNVSNVRPMHLSITANARILKDPTGCDGKRIMEEFDREYFGEAAERITPLREAYYKAFADFGEELAALFAEKWFFFYHRYPTLPFMRNAATDGQLTWLGKYALLGKLHCDVDYASKARLPALLESEEKLMALMEKMDAVAPTLSEEKSLYFRQFLRYQTVHLLYLTRWCIACLNLVDPTLPTEKRKTAGTLAVMQLEAILEERKILEQGKWKNWHKGDEKMNIPLRLAETKKYLESL